MKVHTPEETWKVNEAFLKQQVTANKEIILSHDPAKAIGFFKKEVEVLERLNYRFVKDGWVWRAVR